MIQYLFARLWCDDSLGVASQFVAPWRRARHCPMFLDKNFHSYSKAIKFGYLFIFCQFWKSNSVIHRKWFRRNSQKPSWKCTHDEIKLQRTKRFTWNNLKPNKLDETDVPSIRSWKPEWCSPKKCCRAIIDNQTHQSKSHWSDLRNMKSAEKPYNGHKNIQKSKLKNFP